MKKTGTRKIHFTIRATAFGSLAVLWAGQTDRPKVHRILIPRPAMPVEERLKKRFRDAHPMTCAVIEDLGDRIEAFLKGKDIRFSLDLARLDLCTDLQRSVLLAEYEIPRGFVSTYQEIAAHLGKPRAARAVGTALANNPFPIIIPCHRAIRSDGTPGGYQGGVEMKRRLLEMEGVLFDRTGKVVWKAVQR